MTFILAWTLTLLILILLTFALGLLIERRKVDLIDPIVLCAAGFALLISIGTFFTNFSATAKFATGIIVALAIFSFAWNRSQLKAQISNYFSIIVLIVSYLLAGLPVISTFKVSWPGWVQLDDTGTFLALTNHIMKNGHEVPQQIVSTYDRTLQVILGGSFYGTYDASTNSAAFSYPVGSLIPLGVTGQISRVDLAWLYFPYLAFGVALTAGLFYVISRKFIDNRWLATIVAISSAFASTFYAYALWGGIKEVTLLPILIYSLLVYQKLNKANLLPIFIVSAAIFAIGGKSGLGFITAEIALFSLFKFIQVRRDFFSRKIIISLSVIAVGFLLLSRFLIDFFNSYLIPEIPDSGNLVRPVNMLQILGIWPSGDFRGDIYWQPYSYLALALAGILALYGLFKALRSEHQFIAVGLITTLAITIYSSIFSGIWLTGKAIAVASPFFLITIFFGIFQLFSREKMKWIASSSLAIVILGAAASNYLAYRHTWIAPSEKVVELEKIGKDFKGEGPTLMTEYAVLGARYFLRDLQTQSASELRADAIPMRDGRVLEKGFAADIDLFDNSVIKQFKLLVLRHTASGSRPLFNYDLAYKGKYYDVWRQNQFGKEEIKSISLGNNYLAVAQPTCDEIKKLTEGVTGKIYAAERSPNFITSLTDGQLEPDWSFDKGNIGAVRPINGGYLQGIVDVDKTGDYKWFIAGSYPGDLEIYLDQVKIFTGNTFFEGNKFLSSYLFTSKVKAGKHLLEIRYSKPLLRAGAGVNEPMGPIYLSRETAADSRVVSANNDNIERLCNRNLDWIAWVKN